MNEHEHQDMETYDGVISQLEGILNEDNATISEFIDGRVKSLTEMAVQKDSISLATHVRHEGIIAPETEVKRTFFLDGFRLNDPKIYQLFLDVLKELKESDSWQDMSTKEIMPTVILLTVRRYFGNLTISQDVEANNREFYMDHSTADSEPINLEDLRGQGIAVCAEKAALAQNILAFAGLRPELVMADCELISGVSGGHAYNIVRTLKGLFILDITNPIFYSDKDGNIINFAPSIYRISEDQYSAADAGDSIEVKHTDYKQDDSGNWQPVVSMRKYGR